jgi:rare lipoprotein A
VNDRGPYIKSRLIDLSYLAAKDLGLINAGTADVSLKVISLGKSSDVQIVDRETQIEFKSSDTSKTEMFLPFKPELLEKKYQYIKVVKQPDGNSKIEYLDSRQK